MCVSQADQREREKCPAVFLESVEPALLHLSDFYDGAAHLCYIAPVFHIFWIFPVSVSSAGGGCRFLWTFALDQSV